MNDNDGMKGWQTADPDPGPTPVVTHAVTNHHRAEVKRASVALAVRMMCIVTFAEDSSCKV